MPTALCRQTHHLSAPCALLLLVILLCVCDLAQFVRSWSGSDAYTIVVLNDFDSDVVLQEQFYNAPSGTPFTLSRGGYRVLDTAADASHTVAGSGGAAASVPAAYPLDSTLTTGVAYEGPKACDAPLPFRGRLSSEWVVWTKEDVPHPTANDDDDAETASRLLLHCRLPLPQNRTETRRHVRRYIDQHAASLSAALEAWWHTAPAAHASHCLYGDGEKALTGVERYYELCPSGVVRRVQHHRLLALLRGPATKLAGDTRKLGKQKGGTSPSVLDFLHQMHASPAARHDVLRNPRFHDVFEEIGHYHPRHSKPRWNKAYLTWESLYPSTQPCATHFTTFATGNASERGHRKVHRDDPYWKTVVRFRCPSQPSAAEKHKLSMWTVTEVRQLCEYHVEVMSELVCGWEQELDSFNVNPVPCVVLD